ncbi:MAG: hypothetical protein WC582_01655 [Patescibacteria group bacterium]
MSVHNSLKSRVVLLKSKITANLARAKARKKRKREERKEAEVSAARARGISVQ